MNTFSMKSKIACIGNMNHYMLNLVRFLREDGFDAYLLLLNEPDVFQPDKDCFDDSYKNYTRQTDWKEKPFYEISKHKLAKDLKEFDFIIGCDSSPAFVHKAGRVLDVFVPFGDDIYRLPFFKRSIEFSIKPKEMYSNISWYKRHNEYPRSQKAGINKTKHIFMPKTNPDFESILKEFTVNSRKTLECPSVYTSIYNKESIKSFYPKSEQYEYFLKVKESSDILVFHHCRHLWKKRNDTFMNKGNDKIFYALQDFKKDYPEIKLKVLLCEYGDDVKDSKELIASLGVEDMVVWFPKLPRKEIMVGISLADAGIGELAFSWLSYNALNEYMSMALPVAHTRNDEDFKDDYVYLYPMHHVNSKHDVYEFFEKLHFNKAEMIEMGKNSRKWYLENSIVPSVKGIKEALNL